MNSLSEKVEANNTDRCNQKLLVCISETDTCLKSPTVWTNNWKCVFIESLLPQGFQHIYCERCQWLLVLYYTKKASQTFFIMNMIVFKILWRCVQINCLYIFTIIYFIFASLHLLLSPCAMDLCIHDFHLLYLKLQGQYLYSHHFSI